MRVASTEVYEDFVYLLEAKPDAQVKARAEAAAGEVLSSELVQGRGAILVFDDSLVHKRNFLRPFPAEVVVTSPSELVAAFIALAKS